MQQKPGDSKLKCRLHYHGTGYHSTKDTVRYLNRKHLTAEKVIQYFAKVLVRCSVPGKRWVSGQAWLLTQQIEW